MRERERREEGKLKCRWTKISVIMNNLFRGGREH